VPDKNSTPGAVPESPAPDSSAPDRDTANGRGTNGSAANGSTTNGSAASGGKPGWAGRGAASGGKPGWAGRGAASGGKPGWAGRGAATPGRPPRASRAMRLATAGLLMALAAAGAGLATYLVARPSNATAQLPRISGIPASIPTSLANLMQLSPLAGSPAPGFTLTDQAGHTMPLSAFRGKVVVLEFMDPHCTDICPIVSQEFVDAYHELGPAASKVVFAAVNVNQYYAAVTNVAAFSREHQLTTIPSWHFFTGPLPRLQAAWRDYHIDVQAPHPNGDILHTSAVYFIDPQGRERFVASPTVDHTKSGTAFLPVRQIAVWGHGIAVLARGLAR
jgi:cytochrome oxidase Cu insertion factor (SCO1/SenC/PrrC family)